MSWTSKLGSPLDRIPCPEHHIDDRPFLRIVSGLRVDDETADGRIRPEFGPTAVTALDLNTTQENR